MKIIKSKYKVCRRYGVNFYNKKIKKSKLDQCPGQHCKKLNINPSQLYKLQLYETQKVKAFYHGITTKQLKKINFTALKSDNPSKTFNEEIYRRLHCFILRNFDTDSPFLINQQIRHGKVKVNNKKVIYKSFKLSNNDTVEYNGKKLLFTENQIPKKMPFKPNFQFIMDFYRR